MTTESILIAFNEWAHPHHIYHSMEKQETPGALLDHRALLTPEEAAVYGPGICLTIEATAFGGEAAQLSFWIPDTLKKGTWCSIGSEDDDEVISEWIPDFSSEKEFIGFVDRATRKFLLQYIYEPALDEWFAEKSLTYKVVEKKEFCGGAAEESFNGDLMEWLFVEFKDASGYDITLGISGKGGAATFHANEDGFLDFDQRGDGFKTGEDLTKWVESVISEKA